MITPAQRAEIRRLYFGEHWKVGTIAAALGIHHETVRAALQHETGGLRRGVSRSSALDPFLPFIRDTLTPYPRLRATRLHEMLRLRGYPGSAVQVRRLVRRLRPQTATHVYRRVVTLVGEQAQVDWGTFGTVRIGHGVRTVSGFVMVLGYSRALFALFTLDQTLESFLRGHVAAFEALGGSARTLVYDNLRSAGLDRRGTAIQFHPRLLELAGHYHFAPRPCTPARGNEKGKVERQIQYLRHAFFAARPFRDLDDLNTQFRRWRDDIAHQRRHPEHRDRTVGNVLAEEQPRLLPLPAHPFETDVLRALRQDALRPLRSESVLDSPHARAAPPHARGQRDHRPAPGRPDRAGPPSAQLRHGADPRRRRASRGPARRHAPGQRPHRPGPAPRGGPGHRHPLSSASRPAARPGAHTPGVRDLDVRPHRLESYDALTRRPDDLDE